MTARSVVHVLVATREMSEEEPFRCIDQGFCEGTCFPVELPQFPQIVYITNFHVVQEARGRLCSLATAESGKRRVRARVIFTIPSMDIAILEEWPEDGECLVVRPLQLEESRVPCESQRVYTVGFPEGLTIQSSFGFLSGRSPDLEDHLVFNLSINHGNSGGPIFDQNTNKVIAVATQTIQGVEGVAMGVPVWHLLRYLKSWSSMGGHMPKWGFKLQARSEGFDAEYGCHLEGGAVVQKDFQELKRGDVLVAICSMGIRMELDRYGELTDTTRLSKVSPHSWPMILSLDPQSSWVEIWRRGMHMKVRMSPCLLPGCPTRFPEYDPPRYFLFGGMCISELTTSHLEDEGDLMAAEQLLKIVHEVKKKKPLCVISFLHPESYACKKELLKPFEIVEKIGRYVCKDIEGMRGEMQRVAQRYASGLQQRLCLLVGDRKVYLDLDRLQEDQLAHTEECGEEGLL